MPAASDRASERPSRPKTRLSVVATTAADVTLASFARGDIRRTSAQLGT
jgi:hypothetical protein